VLIRKKSWVLCAKVEEIIYKRWRIIYKIDDDEVYVLLVADSSRNLEDILFQRLIKSDNKTE
jgi:mRNA-degrading endonuclease RelE of RelBE toxin-antitoxin system